MTGSSERLRLAIADRYVIERELGQGGMATVFLARDVKHQRDVALKVLRPELAQSLGAERFLREIRISAQLNHPNILTLIDSGEAGGFMYYVLPYVAGESLGQRLARERQLPLEEALRITREVADALGYAHSLGIVHRDIKPENILFEAGHAMVADFGIARAVSEAGADRLTETGLAIGTPAYMSPEQATADPMVDGRSDIYSLACVLYEMLSGAPPYLGPTPQAVLARKVAEPVPGLRVVRDSVPVAVEHAVTRALARVPADRFPTADAFAAALTDDAAAAPRPRRFARLRSPGVVVAAGLLVAALGAAGYAALHFAAGSREVAEAPATFTRVTTAPGVEWFPSLSPDGEWLVYAGNSSGKRDIYLQSVGGSHAIDLTRDDSIDDDQPAFSPDGQRIAFRSDRDGGGIFVMGRTGEAVRRVTDFGYRPTWSPDGTHLALVTENVGLNPENAEGRSELWVVEIRTGRTRRLPVADAVLPSWSPHGQRIAFMMRLGRSGLGHLWTVPAGGGEARQVTTGQARDWNPEWSSDGRYLYFTSNRNGSTNLWRVRIDERSGRTRGAPEPITTPATSVAQFSVAREGKLVAYTSVDVTTNIQTLAFDPRRGIVAGQPAWLTTGSRRWANPDPSPDGAQAVMYSLTLPAGDLYVIDSGGSGLRQLTGDSASDRLPRWSPDGQWIAFFSDRSGSLQLWKVRPDGSGLTQLTTSGENTAYAVWSPDGSRMAGASPDSAGVVVFDPRRPWDAQRPDTLPTPPADLSPFAPHAWSADGRRLAGMVSSRDDGVVLYDFASRRYTRLTNFGQWPVWLPDSRRLLFVSGGHAFYVVDRVTRRVRKVFSVIRDVLGPPQLTRDGRMIYFSRRDTEADIWLMARP